MATDPRRAARASRIATLTVRNAHECMRMFTISSACLCNTLQPENFTHVHAWHAQHGTRGRGAPAAQRLARHAAGQAADARAKVEPGSVCGVGVLFTGLTCLKFGACMHAEIEVEMRSDVAVSSRTFAVAPVAAYRTPRTLLLDCRELTPPRMRGLERLRSLSTHFPTRRTCTAAQSYGR